MQESKLNHNCIIVDISSLLHLSPSLLYFIFFCPFSLMFPSDQTRPLRSNLRNRHVQTGGRQTINAISGCDWHMALMNSLGSISLRSPRRPDWQLYLLPVSLSLSHTPSQTSRCSPVSCCADIVCVWCWCQTRSQMICCVPDCLWARESDSSRAGEGIRAMKKNCCLVENVGKLCN